nr:MAG: ORF1 [TTV-like mini virus]
MPPYWRRNYRYRNWRRRRPYRWRTRGFVRRQRFRRRRAYRVRRRRIRKKLSKIRVHEFQPETIRLCKIKGTKCLFQGGYDRRSNNYAQYIGSIVPEHEPGGGGWSLMVFSLDSLWEDYEHLQNIWTTSNAGLPLCRFLGVTMKFYQQEYTDYVVNYDLCWPMKDTPLTHANSHPQRMLLQKNKIVVPSLLTKRRKKPYVKKFIQPPAQLKNEWYFQKDLAGVDLLMLTTTACDLRNSFISPPAKSNNITLTSLNTNFWYNRNFQRPSATTGYSPKNNTYMYTQGNGTTATPTNKAQLIYLGNSIDYQPGSKLPNSQSEGGQMTTWGNPFYHLYTQTDIPIYVSQMPPTTLPTNVTGKITETTQYLGVKVRYNPEKDTGEGNMAYFLPNTTGSGWDPPEDPNLRIEGFPLWVMLWGWADWIKKLAHIGKVDENYMLVVRSSFFDSQLPAYVFLDDSFWNGEGPYKTQMSTYDHFHWYPQFKYQKLSIETISTSGPYVAHTPSQNALQAKCIYSFKFKWGGCPRTIEKIYAPSSQPTWITPHNFTIGSKIQNPRTNPLTYIYPWDTKRDIITEKALQRIQEQQETDELLSKSTGIPSTSRSDPKPILQKTQESDQETSSEEEEKTPLQLQLNKLRRRQRLLKQLLLKTHQNIE